MLRLRTLIWQFTCLLALGDFHNLLAQTPAKPEETNKESAVVVELIEAGKSPHRQLRFTPKAGDKLLKIMTTKMNQEMTVAGQKAPQVGVPGQKFFIDIETKKVNSNGEIEFEYSYVDLEIDDDPNMPSPIASQMESMLKPLVGTKGSATITNRGLTKKAEFETPGELNPIIKNVLEMRWRSWWQIRDP